VIVFRSHCVLSSIGRDAEWAGEVPPGSSTADLQRVWTAASRRRHLLRIARRAARCLLFDLKSQVPDRERLAHRDKSSVGMPRHDPHFASRVVRSDELGTQPRREGRGRSEGRPVRAAVSRSVDKPTAFTVTNSAEER
jgi:hypothetical protein